MAVGHADNIQGHTAGQALTTSATAGTAAGGANRALPYDAVEVWTIIASRICLAGGAYPVLLAVASSGLMIVVGVLTRRSGSLEDLIMMPIMVGASALIGGGIGIVWAGLVSLFVVPLHYLFVRSLRLQANLVWLGAGCGGLVGFVAVMPFLGLLIFAGPPVAMGWTALIGPILIGPCITTILGQIGGAVGGLRAMQLTAAETAKVLAAAEQWGRESGGSTRHDSRSRSAASRRPLLQFRIHHLLWVTLWISVLLGAIRLSGLSFELILPLLLGWAGFQAGTLAIGWWAICRIWPRWRAWRGRRSM